MASAKEAHHEATPTGVVLAVDKVPSKMTPSTNPRLLQRQSTSMDVLVVLSQEDEESTEIDDWTEMSSTQLSLLREEQNCVTSLETHSEEEEEEEEEDVVANTSLTSTEEERQVSPIAVVPDEEEDDDSVDKGALRASPPTTRPRERKSILKDFSVVDLEISDKRGVWKQLKKPSCIGRARSLPTPTTTTTTPLAGDTSSSAPVKRVSFDSAEIRHYKLTLGDNPSVSYGPPIALDWEHVGQEKLDIDVYEASRAPRRKLRHLQLNYYQRRGILLNKLGLSEEQVNQAEVEANKVKRQRAMTQSLLPVRVLEEAIQSAARKAKRYANKQ